jgi:hypothetical protein
LLIPGVWADDSFGNTHPEESRAEARWSGGLNLTGFHCKNACLDEARAQTALN